MASVQHISADAVVIGAGVLGSSVALELARSGRSVVMVERGPAPGTGSTSASVAIVRFNYSTPDGVALAWESLHGWLDWAGHLQAPAGAQLARFQRTGGVVLDLPAGPARTDLLARAGVPFEVWDAATLAARLPAVDPGRHHPPKRVDDPAFWDDAHGEVGGVFTPDAGFVDDPQLAAANLADAAVRRGATLLLHRTVVAVRRDGDRVLGVDLDDGTTVDAAVVVNVAGPASARVNELAGVGAEFRVRTRPLRQEVHHLAAPAGFVLGTDLTPFVADADLGVYLRAAPGGGLLLGGVEPECDPMQWLDDPDVLVDHPTQQVWVAQTTRAARRLPELRVPSTARGVVGVYDVSDDWTPVYDRTDLGGWFVAMGTSGNQFKNAPVVGQLMTALVDAVCAGHDHDADPVRLTLPRTGLPLTLATFSRLREIHSGSTFSVMG